MRINPTGSQLNLRLPLSRINPTGSQLNRGNNDILKHNLNCLLFKLNFELITCVRRSFPFADADSIEIFPNVFSKPLCHVLDNELRSLAVCFIGVTWGSLCCHVTRRNFRSLVYIRCVMRCVCCSLAVRLYCSRHQFILYRIV